MINKVCSLLHSLIMIHNEVTLAVRHPKGAETLHARNGLLVKERPLGMDFWSKERPLGRS